MNRVWHRTARRCLSTALRPSTLHRSTLPKISAIPRQGHDYLKSKPITISAIQTPQVKGIPASLLLSTGGYVRKGNDFRAGVSVDRHLEMVAEYNDDESARVLSCWISDPNVCPSVFARPNAVPVLFSFILSQDEYQNEKRGYSSNILASSLKGRAMLVAAIMDVVTSNCDKIGTVYWQPLLPPNPPKGDIDQTFKLLEHPKHEAFRFAAWAVANWTITYEYDMEQLGYEWNLGLLSIVSRACRTNDTSLAHLALNAVLVSIQSNLGARGVVMKEGEHILREAAKWGGDHKAIQVTLTRILDLLCRWEHNLPFKQCLKWSGILLPWVFGSLSSQVTRSFSIDILSRTLEYYGPLTVPITQAWLAILLNEISSSIHGILTCKMAQPSDAAKTQINDLIIASPSMIANQLAAAVVSHAGNQFGTSDGSKDAISLSDFLPLEYFNGLFDNVKENKIPNMKAVDYAAATSRGMKALADICGENPSCLDEVAKSGFLCVIRRLLLDDDYEQLVAAEAYHASRALKEDDCPGSEQTFVYDTNDLFSVHPSHIQKESRIGGEVLDPTILSVQGNRKPEDGECISWPTESNRYGKYNRHQVAAMKAYFALRALERPECACPSGQLVPHATHIRRHAARLLAVLSDLPEVQKEILCDLSFRKWLEDCSTGEIPECNEHAIQTNVRATLLNVISREKGQVINVDLENVTLRLSTFSTCIARIENSPPETLSEFSSMEDAHLAGNLEVYKTDDGWRKAQVYKELTGEMRSRNRLHNSMHMVGLMLSGREKGSLMPPHLNDYHGCREVRKLVKEHFNSPLLYHPITYLRPFEGTWIAGDALIEACEVVADIMGISKKIR